MLTVSQLHFFLLCMQYFQTLKFQTLVNALIGYLGLFKICFSHFFTFREHLQQNLNSCLGSTDILSKQAQRLDIHMTAKPMKSFPSQRGWGCGMLKCITLLGLGVSQSLFCCACMKNHQAWGKRRGRGSSATKVSSSKTFVKKTKIFRL